MITDGCLCGAVHWRATSDPRVVHYCHCSMCRRWTGAAFATLAWFPRDAVVCNGLAASFRAWPIAVRTHCAACGTPLSLAYDGRDDIALAIGSLDNPDSSARPIITAWRGGCRRSTSAKGCRRRLPTSTGRRRTDAPDRADQEDGRDRDRTGQAAKGGAAVVGQTARGAPPSFRGRRQDAKQCRPAADDLPVRRPPTARARSRGDLRGAVRG